MTRARCKANDAYRSVLVLVLVLVWAGEWLLVSGRVRLRVVEELSV